MPQYTTDDAACFWANVDTSGDCWLWTAHKLTRGYGRFCIRGTWVLAHRLAYELTHGPIPTGAFICHHCDNPSCVRPDHLFCGTQHDNMSDCVQKNRHGSQRHPDTRPRGERHYTHQRPEDRLRGEQHGRARLTAEQVRAIRNRYKSGALLRHLAHDYGVSISAVWHIVNGDTWQHIE